jgi:hypothetical protein
MMGMKKRCTACGYEGEAWGFCPKCGALFWGRVLWDLVSGTVCAGMGGYLAFSEPDWRYRTLWAIIATSGAWTLIKIIGQLAQAWKLRQSSSSAR